MAFTKITAAGIGTTESVTLDGLSVINNGSFGGNLTVGGVLTYEDVTNVDSVGLITARNGIVVGSGITLSKDGDVFFTGIATGNGSGLTALNASNISSGTVPTARLGSGTASSSTFLRGDSTFAAVTSTTINNNANNRVITGSGTANTLEGEANLQFDGTNIGVGVAPSGVSSYSTIHLKGQTSGNGGAVRLTDYGDTPDSDDFTIYKNSAAGYLRINGTDPLIAYLNGAERARIDSSGRLLIGTTTEGEASADNLTIADSGNCGMTIRSGSSNAGGIYFSDGTSGDAEYRGLIAYNQSSDYLQIFTGAAERLRMDAYGRILIGTTSTVIGSSADFAEIVLGGRLKGAGITLQDVDSNVRFQIRTDDDASGTLGTLLNASTNHDIFFRTNNTERLRIKSDGSVLLGATSYGGGGADPIFYVSGTSGRLVKIHNTNSATTSLQLTNAATGQGEDQGMQLAALANGECGIFNAEAERILIQSQEADTNKPVVNFMKPQGPSNAQTVMIAFETGNQGRGAVLSSSSDGGSPSFTSLSDYRIKTNIRDYTDGYDNIKAIPVKLFDMVSDGTKDIKGWIAHEVQAHIPEAVMGVKDAVDGDENPILQQLSYGLFMPDVVSALQTAIAKIEVLETRLNNAGIAT